MGDGETLVVLLREAYPPRIKLTVSSVAADRLLQDDSPLARGSMRPRRRPGTWSVRLSDGADPAAARRTVAARQQVGVQAMTPRVAPARRRLIVAAIVFAASATPVAGQGRPHYRAYAMGDSLLAISRQVGLPVIDATTTPAVSGAVQELRWHARYVRRGTAPSGDPVDRLVFSFYEHRLFRIVIDYAPDRTDGMTESDMVGAVSALYGSPIRRTLASHAGRHRAGAAGRNPDRGMDQRRSVGRPAGAAGTDGVPVDCRLLGAPDAGSRGRCP